MTVSNSPYSQQNVRRNMLSFIFGRGISALITFSILILAARAMDLHAYGQYMLILAGMEIAMALGTFGIDWVIARYVPACRQHGSVSKLKRLVFLSLFSQLFLLAVVVFIAAIFLSLSVFSIPEFPIPLLWLVVFLYIGEGLGRIIRDQILGALMLQAGAQKAQVLRGLVVIAGMGLFLFFGVAFEVYSVIALELFAAISSAMLSLYFLFVALAKINNPEDDSWASPDFSRLIKFSLSAYINTVSMILTGPQVLIFLTASFWGAASAGLFGFARSISEQIRRYIPSELLLGVVRPVAMAKVNSSGFNQNSIASVLELSKFSLFVLSIISAFVVALGSNMIGYFVGEKYRAAQPILALVVILIAVFPIRRILEIFYFSDSKEHYLTIQNCIVAGGGFLVFLLSAYYGSSLYFCVFLYVVCIHFIQLLFIFKLFLKQNDFLKGVFVQYILFLLMALCVLLEGTAVYFVSVVAILAFLVYGVKGFTGLKKIIR